MKQRLAVGFLILSFAWVGGPLARAQDSADGQGAGAGNQNSGSQGQGGEDQGGARREGDEATPPGGGEAAVAETPPPAPDPEFVNLPAYDVEVPPGGAVRVGDSVPLKIVGAGAIPSANTFHLALPKGMDSGTVLDQGLDVPALAATADAEAGTAPPAAPGASASPSAPKSALEVAGPDLKFPVVAAKPGQLAIPSLAIVDASGKAIARTNPFSLQVHSAIPTTDKKPQEPAPPRPPVTLSFPWIVIAGLVLLALLVIGGIVYGLVRLSRRNRSVVAPVAPVVPLKSEDEIALAALGELEGQRLMSQGQFKRHYFQLSELLKAYLGARYRVDAVESTTREMLAMLEHTTLVPESLRELESLFAKLDFVKFTDHVPEGSEGDELLSRARALVLKTRKPPISHAPIIPATAKSPTEAPRAI